MAATETIDNIKSVTISNTPKMNIKRLISLV